MHLKKIGCHLLMGAAALSLVSSIAMASDDENKVNIWNWSDYIAEDTVENFEKSTGIKSNYVLFDSNELIEARMLSGYTGFDAIMMTSYYVPRLAKAGALEKINKAEIANYHKLDPIRMQKLATVDPNNDYAIPYTEISLGIGYNTKKIAEIFGEDYKVDSWDFVFKPENAAKLRQCGIAVLDSPIEIVSLAQFYLHKDPTSEKREDYLEARELLTNFARNVAYIHSSRYINDLASGDVCVAIGYSGDILQANERARVAKRDYSINYVFPKEGSLLWYDCWIVPRRAPHPSNASKWFSYLLETDVSTAISDEIRYILPNKEAIPHLDADLQANPSVNLSPEDLEKAYFPKPPTGKVSKIVNSVWNYMKLNSDTEDVSEWQ